MIEIHKSCPQLQALWLKQIRGEFSPGRDMAAPLKPWERTGVNSRAFGGDVGATLPTHVKYVSITLILIYQMNSH